MKKSRIISLLLVVMMLITAIPMTAAAKTNESARGDVLFFYAADSTGKDVLMKVITLSELKQLSHAYTQNGTNYMYSSTDNYPTMQYAEGKGFTLSELVEYVKENSSAKGATSLTFSGSDTMGFMATDSFGNYTRTWAYDELCGETRYYFEGLYDSSSGWNTGWEVAGDDNSKYGITLEEYNSKYAASDQYNADKKAVLAEGIEMPVILATESYSGRTTSQTLNASTEPGIASYISANGGVVAGCLADALTDDYSLRLCIPMTEADLMSGHRTSYDNFKWVYNVRLDNTSKGSSSAVNSAGTVAAPEAQVSVSGNTMTITMDCETEGADIYYSFDGSPQILYTSPVTYDVTGRDLTGSPVTFYMTAVKEGWDDAGIVTVKYPQSGVTFQTLYSSQTGNDIVFTAENGVSSQDWNSWSGNIMGVSMKKPQGNSYDALSTDKYSVNDSAKTITFDKSLFDQTGSYSFIIYAKGFSNKNISVSLKNAAPQVSAAVNESDGSITVKFDDSQYQNSLYIYTSPSGDSSSVLIPANYIDKSVNGQVTIKSEYFSSDSCSMKEAGTYTLELTNNSYSPSSQTVQVTVGGGTPVVSESSFKDVKSTDWFASAVSYAVKNGLFTGTGTDTFSPDGNMTRGMLVTVLYRLDGSSAVTSVSGESGAQTASSGFSDVKSTAYYANAVAWASANGIVNGVSGDRFEPDTSVTRQQMAAILYRYAGYKNYSTDGGISIDSYSDASGVSAYAKEAMQWASGAGLINGISASVLGPSSTATRAQVAAILQRFSEKFQ